MPTGAVQPKELEFSSASLHAIVNKSQLFYTHSDNESRLLVFIYEQGRTQKFLGGGERNICFTSSANDQYNDQN